MRLCCTQMLDSNDTEPNIHGWYSKELYVSHIRLVDSLKMKFCGLVVYVLEVYLDGTCMSTIILFKESLYLMYTIAPLTIRSRSAKNIIYVYWCRQIARKSSVRTLWNFRWVFSGSFVCVKVDGRSGINLVCGLQGVSGVKRKKRLFGGRGGLHKEKLFNEPPPKSIP